MMSTQPILQPLRDIKMFTNHKPSALAEYTFTKKKSVMKMFSFASSLADNETKIKHHKVAYVKSLYIDHSQKIIIFDDNLKLNIFDLYMFLFIYLFIYLSLFIYLFV